MKGLNAAILSLSLVKNDNEKVRFDSGYFDKTALHAASLLHGKATETLGAICCTLRKGIFDIKADTYVEEDEGIPFVRIGDMNRGLIETSSTAWISEEAHKKEGKTRLVFGDIVISKTAYPMSSYVNIPECNVSQDLIAVKISNIGATQFKNGFIISYLNCEIGLPIMRRYFQGNVQQHISLDDAKKISIPCLSYGLQAKIDDAVRHAIVKHESAQSYVREAEKNLLMALELANWKPPEPLSYIAPSTEVLMANRLDAQYFMPAKRVVREALATSPGRPLGELFDSIREMFHPGRDAAPAMVRNYDVTDALQPILDDEKEPVATEEVGSIKKVLKDGDVAISRLRAYLREIAVVRTAGKMPSVGSSEFIVLRPRDRDKNRIAPETLLTFLRSAPVQTILKWCQDGSQHPRFSESDLLSIHVPDAVADASPQIEAIVKQGFEARRRSRELLERAKRAVEIAIEDSEAAALRFLDDAGV